MGPREIVWRIGQKRLQKRERSQFYSLNLPVTKCPLPANISKLKIDCERLSINWSNKKWSIFETLNLFDVFEYSDYKYKWNAGFQTKNKWPEKAYSPTIIIGQREDIGDIRTNWELNRHFQFALLSKNYYCTKNKSYLDELRGLFYDWNKHNLFLHGVEWTSAMELAIRVNSWVYTLAFLKKSGYAGKIVEELEHGILVMTHYILKHRARYSSANNHLIVEMYAVALVGILSNNSPWVEEALSTLSDELVFQNYDDGINKEMSLHYQGFVMEAFGLLCLQMKKNGIRIPEIKKKYLTAMARFLADSTDDYGTTIEFGDNDEGKILDLHGRIDNYYQYILSLMSYILDCEYTKIEWNENLNWILPNTDKEFEKKYCPNNITSRKKGGYTFLRNNSRSILLGIDHGDLGYGRVAAHGHADALSFQVAYCGKKIFVDSGTFNYHVTKKERDYYRSTKAHNTVECGGENQSQMLGPFLWGKRAQTYLKECSENKGISHLLAVTQYNGNTHERQIDLHPNKIIINDSVTGKSRKNVFRLIFGPDLSRVEVDNDHFSVDLVYGDRVFTVSSNKKIKLRKSTYMYSDSYNNAICVSGIEILFEDKLSTEISFS